MTRRPTPAGRLWADAYGRIQGAPSEARRARLQLARRTLAEARSRPASVIDEKTAALLRVAATIAVDAAPYSFQHAVALAIEAGATSDEIVATLEAVTPVTGAARVVQCAPKLALALGYDVDAALERRDPDGPADRDPQRPQPLDGVVARDRGAHAARRRGRSRGGYRGRPSRRQWSSSPSGCWWAPRCSARSTSRARAGRCERWRRRRWRSCCSATPRASISGCFAARSGCRCACSGSDCR